MGQGDRQTLGEDGSSAHLLDSRVEVPGYFGHACAGQQGGRSRQRCRGARAAAGVAQVVTTACLRRAMRAAAEPLLRVRRKARQPIDTGAGPAPANSHVGGVPWS